MRHWRRQPSRAARCAAIPDPQDRETFERSKLQWDEIQRDPHAGVRRLYQRLLQLRANDVIRAATRERYDVRALDQHTLMLTLMCGAEPGDRDLTAIVRLTGAGAVRVAGAGATWHDVLVTTEDADVAADSLPIRVDAAAPAIRGDPWPRTRLVRPRGGPCGGACWLGFRQLDRNAVRPSRDE